MAVLSLALAAMLSGTSAVYAQEPTGDQQGPDDQSPTLACSIHVTEDQANLASLARISADQAVQAALAAHPGTAANKVELDSENGCLVYSVELTNQSDVKVDAGNGHVLATEVATPGEGDSASDSGSEGDSRDGGD